MPAHPNPPAGSESVLGVGLPISGSHELPNSNPDGEGQDDPDPHRSASRCHVHDGIRSESKLEQYVDRHGL
ncbi:MAG TPA: hypothetical protein VM686_09825, partial [Polyangiaceae bacterium]|nr:hypothetical protein [Polyangiaceae bacterium]